MDGKKCTRCHFVLPLEEFYKRLVKKDGRTSECKKCNNERQRKYRKNNLEKVRAQARGHRKNNLEKIRSRAREYRKNNLEKVRVQNREGHLRFLSKPKNRIRNIMTARIYQALKNGRISSWNHCLDYTVEELECHLESKFTKGMSWDNYGYYGWHIDHKIPVSYFVFSSPRNIEFKKCWALDNLQPMWAKENLSKSNKLVYLEGGT